MRYSISAALVGAFILTSCSLSDHSENWYVQHPHALQTKLAQCRASPGNVGCRKATNAESNAAAKGIWKGFGHAPMPPSRPLSDDYAHWAPTAKPAVAQSTPGAAP